MKRNILFGVWVFAFSFLSPASASVLFTFRGQADLSQKQFDVIFDFPRAGPAEFSPENIYSEINAFVEERRASVAVSGARVSDNDYRVSFDIDHFRTPFFDLLSKIESSIEVVREGEAGPSTQSSVAGKTRTTLRGKIWSQNSLVDYRPIRELTGRFEIRDKQIFLDSLSFGNLVWRGAIDLTYPYAMDLVVSLHDVAMEDFLNFWVKDKQYESFGTVSGEIGVSGTWDRLSLKGSLESYDGYVEELQYNTIHLNAEGIYPKMRIVPSLLARTDGVSVTFSGLFDLSDQDNFRKQLGALVLSPLVSNSASEREWTIKRVQQPKSGATEIKYLLRKDDKLGGESDMLGVEQKVNF